MGDGAHKNKNLKSMEQCLSANAPKRRLFARALFHNCSMQLERQVERGGRVEGSEGCTRTATTPISSREKRSRLRRSSKARKLDAECGGRRGFVSSVTKSRKSICGAKLRDFVNADQRDRHDFSIWTIARGDKMALILSIVCKFDGQNARSARLTHRSTAAPRGYPASSGTHAPAGWPRAHLRMTVNELRKSGRRVRGRSRLYQYILMSSIGSFIATGFCEPPIGILRGAGSSRQPGRRLDLPLFFSSFLFRLTSLNLAPHTRHLQMDQNPDLQRIAQSLEN